MHLGLLFYTDTLAMTHTAGGIMGRAVANHGLVRAFASRADPLTIIVSSALEREPLAEWLGALASTVQIRSVTELAQSPHAFDVLHLFGPDLYRGLYLRNTGTIGAPIVTGMTHSLSHAPFLDWLALSALQHPQPGDALICTTPTAAQTVQAMISACVPQLPMLNHLQTPVIPLGIDDTWDITPQPQLRAQWHIPDGALLCLHFGRISATNKVDLLPLLDAWQDMNATRTESPVLVIAGAVADAYELQVLHEAIAERALQQTVRVIPNPDDATKQQLYAAADLAIALADNLQETFGLSVIEALAAGVPVIASNWDGYRALIDESCGWLLPTYTAPDSAIQTMGPLLVDSMRLGACAQATAIDLTALPDILQQCHTQPQMLVARRVAARARGERYRWHYIVEQYREHWFRLCAERAAAQPPQMAPGPTLQPTPMFNHYASATLERTALLTLTARGIRAAIKPDALAIAPMLHEIIPPHVVQQLVQTLSSGPRTVASLLREHRSLDAASHLLSVLHWLLKRGWVVVSE